MIRIISCLDIKNNKVVKGIKFKKLKIIDNPIKLILNYEKKKIDEIVLLDITANYTKKSLNNFVIKKISKIINIPLSIGGGIDSLEKINFYLKIGSDRIILNSFCYNNILLIKNISNSYGTQCLIIAIDFKLLNNKYLTFKNSGFVKTGFDLFDWIIIIKKIGCGEILLTSINNDGECLGYDILTMFYIKKYFRISLIVSGGMGAISDIYYLYKYCKINTYLIASVFHYNYLKPSYIKKYIKKINVL